MELQNYGSSAGGDGAVKAKGPTPTKGPTAPSNITPAGASADKNKSPAPVAQGRYGPSKVAGIVRRSTESPSQAHEEQLQDALAWYESIISDGEGAAPKELLASVEVASAVQAHLAALEGQDEETDDLDPVCKWLYDWARNPPNSAKHLMAVQFAGDAMGLYLTALRPGGPAEHMPQLEAFILALYEHEVANRNDGDETTGPLMAGLDGSRMEQALSMCAGAASAFARAAPLLPPHALSRFGAACYSLACVGHPWVEEQAGEGAVRAWDSVEGGNRGEDGAVEIERGLVAAMCRGLAGCLEAQGLDDGGRKACAAAARALHARALHALATDAMLMTDSLVALL